MWWLFMLVAAISWYLLFGCGGCKGLLFAGVIESILEWLLF
jgi:hypothetical protein